MRIHTGEVVGFSRKPDFHWSRHQLHQSRTRGEWPRIKNFRVPKKESEVESKQTAVHSRAIDRALQSSPRYENMYIVFALAFIALGILVVIYKCN